MKKKTFKIYHKHEKQQKERKEHQLKKKKRMFKSIFLKNKHQKIKRFFPNKHRFIFLKKFLHQIKRNCNSIKTFENNNIWSFGQKKQNFRKTLNFILKKIDKNNIVNAMKVEVFIL